MLKYVDTAVTFAEIPDEITLCINISNCPIHCKGCHSKHLWKNIGTPLTYHKLEKLIKDNQGITCICFMGGDSDPKEINKLAAYLMLAPNIVPLKIAWYSGRQKLSSKIDLFWFNYIKLGPYVKERGPINNPNTNQKLFEIKETKMRNITNKFWKCAKK